MYVLDIVHKMVMVLLHPCLLSEGLVPTTPEAAEGMQGSVCCGVHAAQIYNI